MLCDVGKNGSFAAYDLVLDPVGAVGFSIFMYIRHAFIFITCFDFFDNYWKNSSYS